MERFYTLLSLRMVPYPTSFLFLCLAFAVPLSLGGCVHRGSVVQKKTAKQKSVVTKATRQLRDEPTSPQKTSKQPTVRSKISGKRLLYVVSNNSGRTFHRMRILIVGRDCEGKKTRYWTRMYPQPLLDGGSQRFRWRMPVQCGNVLVKAVALRRQGGNVRLRITGFRPPFIRYNVYNLSGSEKYPGFVLHVMGLGCNTPNGRFSQLMYNRHPLLPNSKLTQVVRMRVMCQRVRVRAIPMTRKLRRRILEYMRRRQRQRRKETPNGPQGAPQKPRPPVPTLPKTPDQKPRYNDEV